MEQTAALFKRVYDTYGPSLYRFCLLQMKNPADAEDILQDVLIKRLYQAPKFKSPEHERNWLFQVALNLCRDEWRRHRRSELPLEAAAGVALPPEELSLLEQEEQSEISRQRKLNALRTEMQKAVGEENFICLPLRTWR